MEQDNSLKEINNDILPILRRLSFRQLMYFTELSRFMSFRKASESLNVSQPTLSQQIAQLEESLGTPLLRRSSRGFTLTDEGQRFRALCRALISTCAEGLEDIRTDPGSRPLRLGIPSYQSYRQIDALLTSFKSAFPSIFTHLSEMSAVQMCHALRAKRLDLAFMSLPTPLELPMNTDSLIIWKARYELCLSKDHPLAMRDRIPAAALSQVPLILLPQRPHSPQFNFQLDALTGIGISPNIYPSEITHASAQISLAASGVGACLVVPGSMDLGPDVVTVQTDPPLPEMKLAVFWEKKSLNPMVERFVLHARNADRQMTT